VPILFRHPDRAVADVRHTTKGPLQYDRSISKRMKNPMSTAPDAVRAVGYRRVSTIEQADSGAGLASQQTIIEAEAIRRGWVLVEVHTDEAASGKSLVGRVALEAAITAVESGRADVLVVAKLDRLSRSLLDFANLMARAQTKGWNLVALDLGIDLSTPAGEFLASVMASAAQWERRIIGQRTREGMAAKKAAGVRLGPPRRLPDHLALQILDLRSSGLSWARVAEKLNALAIPTALNGRQWYPSTARNAALAYERDLAHDTAKSL
jgi:DNA invertase Pin-like site-specific DNA recombinase